MDAAILPTMAEFVAGLGFEAAKDRFKEKFDEKQLRSALTVFIEGQRKYNELCSLAEEIDFQGLMEYIEHDLLEDVGIRVFNPRRKKRRQARQEIVDAAVSYSKANTAQAKKRVAKCISICIDIIRDFYVSKHLSIKDYLLANIIVDAVAEDIHESTTAIETSIDAAKSELSAKLDNFGTLFSIDKAVALAGAGAFDSLSMGIKKVLDHISLDHPYYPYFGYEYMNGRILSKPLTEEAKKLFPTKYVLTGAVRFGDQYFNDPDGDPLDYSYRHQLPMTMEVSKALKLLGEKPDPLQDEAAVLVGNTMTAMPPEFPPAFPCSIKAGDVTFFEYVLLRTQEILDDGTYIIGNKEQGGSFYFEVDINPNNPSKPDFKVNMTDASNRDLLNYVKFMSALSVEKDLHIYVLSVGEDIIAGYINELNYRTGFSSVEEEIDFLERICVIEDYFDVRLNPSGEISNAEYEAVIQISSLIRNDEVSGTWSKVTFTGILDKHFREELINVKEDLYAFSYVGISHVELFGAEFEFRFMRTFKCARMVDIEKVRRKAEALEEGDEIKISFCAGDDNGTIDTLKIPEKFTEVA